MKHIQSVKNKLNQTINYCYDIHKFAFIMLCKCITVWSISRLCGGANSSDLIQFETDGYPQSHSGWNGGKGQSNCLRRVCHHLHKLSSTSLYSLRAALLYFTKCFRLAPHDGSHPSCSKPAGYFCSICLLPPTDQLTLQHWDGNLCRFTSKCQSQLWLWQWRISKCQICVWV